MASIEGINNRLVEILKQVDDPELPMEEILRLYEEAVRLGAEVGAVVEQNIADADALAALGDEGAEVVVAAEGEGAEGASEVKE